LTTLRSELEISDQIQLTCLHITIADECPLMSSSKPKIDYSLYLVTGRELLPPGKVSPVECLGRK
jgi:hypothetical protein